MKLWRYGHAIEQLGQRYRLEGTLGSGGMADVCLAWDEHEACEVAIKVIKSDQLEQRTLDRFIKEAAQVARWQHPNILHIYSDLKLELLDATQGSIVPYIVMEYAQGGDLHKRLTPGEPYPFAATLDLFAQLCSAVSYAHEHGVIHRDLKPLNILFRQLSGGCEQVVLSDFGLAVEIDATHHTFAHGGTLLYMAPEQFRGNALPASDIFALGVIFYQLCTGHLPFRRTLQELHQLNSVVPTPPSFIIPTLPEALDNILLTALAPDPEQRYPTAGALWEAIHAIVYSNHLKPAYNTLPRRSSSTTGPRPAISRRTAPQRAIHPIPQESAPVDIVADSQDLPPHTANLAPHTSHTRLRQRQPSSQIDAPNIDIFDNSYSHRILSSNEQAQPISRSAKRRPSNVYGTGDPLRSPSLQSPSFQSPSHLTLSTRPPATHISTQTDLARLPRPIYRIGALTLLLTILCVGALLASLIYFTPAHSLLNMLPNPAIIGGTTVSITPDSQQIANTYTILALPNGTPDPNQRQIAARTLSSQQTQTKNINGTGHNQIPATAAKGTVTFTNGTFSPFTIAAGTQLQAANGATIVTDNSLVIPSADANQNKLGMASISAHAATSGANGNIPPGSISGTCCAANGVIAASNNNAFTGGQDAKNYIFVQQSDVDAFVNTVKPQLIQQANSALTQQLKTSEQLAQSTINCPATVQNDNPIGDQGQNVPSTTITVTVTCKATAYDQNGLRSLVTTLLHQQASTNAGPNYVLQGPITIHTQVQQINQDQSLSLLVNARGFWTYQLSTTQKQQLARLIAGKPTDTARTLLKAQPGVRDVAISTSGATLPSNADQIKIEVQGDPTT